MVACSQQADGWLLESRCQSEALKVPASEESGCQDEAFQIPSSEDFCLPLELELCSERRERLDTPEWWPTSPASSIDTTFPSRWFAVGSSGVDSFSLGCSSWLMSKSVSDADVTESVSCALPRSVSDLGADCDQQDFCLPLELDVLCSGRRERLDTPDWWPTMSATSSMSTTFSGCSSWPLAESVFDDDLTASVSFAEEGKQRAKKESGRTRQRRAKAMRKLACAQLDLC